MTDSISTDTIAMPLKRTK